MQESPSEPQRYSNAVPGRPGDAAARSAGLLLIATAVITLAAVAGRVMADADQPTLVESLAAIAESRLAYGLGGAARFLSGVTLLGGAWFLLTTWIIRQRRATPLVPWLFGASGVITALSGFCAVVLALTATNASGAGSFAEGIEFLRWTTGKLGFTLAGLALLVAARYQWMAGGALRFISPLSVIIGVAMPFIWVDALTLVHRVSGIAFVLWLTAIGFMLSTGRVERLFIARFGPAITDD
jgi:hypothetical protein